MISFYRTCGVNPGRSGCDMALQAEEMVSACRRKLTEFFNASLVGAGKQKDPDRLVFTLNATHSLNLILRGTVGPGDHVVTTWLEHNSVIRPVNHLVKLGAEATFVRPDGEGFVDPEDIRKAIRPNTKLVIVNHGSNVIGAVQDITAIGRVCAEAGVPFAVDTAQTAGVIPIDMAESHVSFLAFTGHKSLFGPTGTGGICVADDAVVESTMWGGTGVKSAYPYHLEEYPYRLEAGTLNVVGIAGLSAGQDWIAAQGLETIRRHELELLAVLDDGFRQIKGVTVYGPKGLDRRVPTVSINVNGLGCLGRRDDRRRRLQHRHPHRPAVRAPGPRPHRHLAERHGAILDRAVQHPRARRDRGPRGRRHRLPPQLTAESNGLLNRRLRIRQWG